MFQYIAFCILFISSCVPSIYDFAYSLYIRIPYLITKLYAWCVPFARLLDSVTIIVNLILLNGFVKYFGLQFKCPHTNRNDWFVS